MKSRQGDLFLNKCRPAPSNRLSFNSFALCVFVIKKLSCRVLKEPLKIPDCFCFLHLFCFSECISENLNEKAN
ncbi:hypothetical protein CapIbe_012408 [Capra ibex]